MPASEAGRKPGRYGIRAWGLVALLAAAPGAAQTVSEKSFFEELPVVLTVSRIPQPLSDVPGAVTVLDREFIRATGYRDLPSLLKLVPGFHVVRERGGIADVTYHGLGNSFPNRMQVLIDGRSVYSLYFHGGVDWFAIPLTIDEIERIEVLRGSNSASFGSNAAMGVVNIITRTAGDHRTTEVGVAAGSNSLFDASLGHARQLGDLGLRLNAEVRYDHGFESLVDSPRRGVVTVRGDYRLSATDELDISAGLNDARRGLGYAGEPANTNGLRALRTENSFLHARWRRSLGRDADLQIGYYHNEEHAEERVTAYLPPFFPTIPIDYDRTSSRDNLDFQHLFSPTPTTRLAWGGELRRDSIRAPRFYFGKGEVRQDLARAFASLEWKPAQTLTVNAGAMLEHYAGSDTKLAPRLFVNWEAVPGHTLRAGQSVAYRGPSPAESRSDTRFYSNGYSGVLLRLSFLGQPEIRPERVAASEIGYLGQFKTWNGVLDVRVFSDKISDFVQDVLTRAPPGVVDPRTYTFANSDTPVRMRGFEGEYSARPMANTLLRATYSNLSVSAPFAGQNHEHEGPHHSATVTWLQEWTARWHTTFSLISYSGYEWGSGSLSVPRYSVVDARIAYRFGSLAKPSELALVLRDQGKRHEEYAPSSNVVTGGRDYYYVPRMVYLTGRFPF